MSGLNPPGTWSTRRLALPRRLPGVLVVGVVAGVLALLLYAATGARGVGFQDSGLHQYRILVRQVENPLGLALSHPLHHWLGRAIVATGIGDPIHALNLLSGVCGAVGVGVLAGLVVALTRSRLAGGLAAATLGLAHAYWQMSAVTETYTLAGALLTIEWALLLAYARTRRPVWLMAVFAVNGLHVADHLLGLLSLATYGVLLLDRIVRRKIAWGWLFAALSAWLVTASPYWTLVVSHGQRTGDLVGTLRSAFFGGGWTRSYAKEVLNMRLSLDQLKQVVLTFGYCFPSAAGLVALLGLWRRARARRRLFRMVLLAQTVLVFLFVGRYSIKDLYTYFVPVCALTALWFGLGAAWLLRRWREPRTRRGLAVLLGVNALLPLVVYLVFPVVARQHDWLHAKLRPIPYREPYAFFFRPWMFREQSADLLARKAIEAAGPNGWVLADLTTAAPIAIKALLTGGPAGLRVYCDRECLYPRGSPPLTDEDLRGHIERGHRVIAVPSRDVEKMVGEAQEPLAIEKNEPFWRVRLVPIESRP